MDIIEMTDILLRQGYAQAIQDLVQFVGDRQSIDLDYLVEKFNGEATEDHEER